jgi:hypothetical protein
MPIAGSESTSRYRRVRRSNENNAKTKTARMHNGMRIRVGSTFRGARIGNAKLRAVVVTVMVALLPAATEAGLLVLGVQAAAVAMIEQLTLTLELKPFEPATATL